MWHLAASRQNKSCYSARDPLLGQPVTVQLLEFCRGGHWSTRGGTRIAGGGGASLKWWGTVAFYEMVRILIFNVFSILITGMVYIHINSETHFYQPHPDCLQPKQKCPCWLLLVNKEDFIRIWRSPSLGLRDAGPRTSRIFYCLALI